MQSCAGEFPVAPGLRRLSGGLKCDTLVSRMLDPLKECHCLDNPAKHLQLTACGERKKGVRIYIGSKMCAIFKA